VRITRFKIPTTIVLPGVLVRVHVVSPVHEELQGNTAAWEYSDDGIANIYLNKKLSLKVQRFALLHELQHVMVDYLDQAIENHPHIFALNRDIRRRKRGK
jgi:hypothetical protein